MSGVSFIGVNVPYQVRSFVAPATGSYTFLSTATSPAGWDNFLVLYRNSFNPAAPLTNAVAANDDLNNSIANIGRSGFSTNLTLGTTYFLVTTAYAGPGLGGTWGAFSNTVSTNATVSSTSAVPEPSTWIMIAFGLATLWLRRKAALPATVPAVAPKSTGGPA